MVPLVEKHTLFHAFCIKPKIRFENQADDEEVLLSLRAHPVTLLPILFNGFIIYIFIFVAGFILGQFLNWVQVLYTMVFFYFVTFIYLWSQLINWYFNVGFVTTKQIIDVNFNIFTFRNVTRTDLHHIEDVTVRVSGFLASIFDFGNIYVQTAGTEVNTEFIQVQHPTQAARIIQDILKEHGNT